MSKFHTEYRLPLKSSTLCGSQPTKTPPKTPANAYAPKEAFRQQCTVSL